MNAARWLVLTAALLFSCFGVGCVAPEAIEQSKNEAAMMQGLAANEGLSLDVRAVGAVEAEAWKAQHRALKGDEVDTTGWAPIPDTVWDHVEAMGLKVPAWIVRKPKPPATAPPGSVRAPGG